LRLETYHTGALRAVLCVTANFADRLPLWVKLDPAIHAFFYEREIDPATEFVRDEIAYEIGAVAGLNLGRHRRTSDLAPLTAYPRQIEERPPS